MTAPDPIREALEAAWRASTVDPDDAPEGVICYQREKAAVTIAAFLRALPVITDLPPGPDRMGFWDHDAREKWASAVTNATQEDSGDGQ